MKNKEPTCKRCKKPFIRYNTIQRLCVECAIKKVREGKDKAHRKDLREGRERLKTKSDWLREAQSAFNKYIRIRDREWPCISCGRDHGGQYHAGHYRTAGSSPELRFSELNCHKQCAPCNNHKSGNIVEYRINLISRIGVDALEWLEGPHEPKHYTIEEIKAIKAKYTKKAKEISHN